MAKDLEISVLYDFYGDMLTEKQQEVIELYYNEDLSLAEIAAHSHITRQGVRDVIVRAEATLTELEDKTGLIKRFYAMQPQIQAILDASEQLLELNRTYDDPKLEELANSIRTAAQSLKEE